MTEPIDKPCLRAVEAIPTVHEGQRVVVLRDPEGYAEHPVVLGERAAWLLGLMDGDRTFVDIQAAYMRRFGDLLFTADLERLVGDLDEACFLESDRYRRRRDEMLRDYREAATRPPAHLGLIGADGETWGRWVDGFLRSAGEPESAPAAPVRGIAAPHIDLRLGGGVYGSAWSALDGEPPQRVVVIGTCHHPIGSLVTATTKSFDTPLGPVETDGDFLRAVDAAAGGGLFDDEIAHRREHTIEFQALFVRRLFGSAGTKIAPILCSYSPLHLSPQAPPEFGERIRAVAGALREEAARRPGRTLFVASADLSHVGPRYGDEAAPTDAERRALEASDRVFLEAARTGDADALSRRLTETNDRTRICGYPPIHLMLTALGPASGALLRYDQGVMGDEGSVVSFAAIAYS